VTREEARNMFDQISAETSDVRDIGAYGREPVWAVSISAVQTARHGNRAIDYLLEVRPGPGHSNPWWHDLFKKLSCHASSLHVTPVDSGITLR
jgi:hypothetical protein